jgi:hypothetical protein
MGTVDWVNTWESWLTQQYGVKWDGGVCGPPNLLGSDPVELVPSIRPATEQEIAYVERLLGQSIQEWGAG